MKDININAWNIEVVYRPDTMPAESEARLLPLSIVVDVHTARQRWRNVHSFSRCKRFTVQSTETVSR